MKRPVRSPAQAIGTAELRAFSKNALSPHVAPPRRLIALERRPSIYSTSFAIEELDVRLDDDTSLRILYKDLSRHALLEEARQAKPTFLYNPMREIVTYRSILGPNRLGTAECYGAIVDPSVERYGLLLEKVPGLELYQVGDLATWRRMSEWLAIMHERFSGQSGQLVRTAPLLCYDGDFYRLWANRAGVFGQFRTAAIEGRSPRHGATLRELRPGRRAPGGAPSDLPSRRVLRLQRACAGEGGRLTRVSTPGSVDLDTEGQTKAPNLDLIG